MAPVPELVAKKAKREEAWAAQKAADALESRKKANDFLISYLASLQQK